MRTKWGAPEKGWPRFDENGRRIPDEITGDVVDLKVHPDGWLVSFDGDIDVIITPKDLVRAGLVAAAYPDDSLVAVARKKGIR